MIDQVNDTSLASELRIVLKRLTVLFGAASLEKRWSVLSVTGYFQASSSSKLHRTVEELCRLLRTDATVLVEAIAPPDSILNSILGRSDGEIYKEFEYEPGTVVVE